MNFESSLKQKKHYSVDFFSADVYLSRLPLLSPLNGHLGNHIFHLGVLQLLYIPNPFIYKAEFDCKISRISHSQRKLWLLDEKIF